MTNNANIQTTSLTQGANELLGKLESKLYYLVITTPKGTMTVNVGQKTHDKIKELTNVITKIDGIGGTQDKKQGGKL